MEVMFDAETARQGDENTFDALNFRLRASCRDDVDMPTRYIE